MRPIMIITGASTGIGLELAKQWAERGYDLGLVARRGALLDELKTEILSKYPETKIETLVLDVAQYDLTYRLILELIQKLGGVNIFVANAGVGARTPAWKPSWPTVKQILEVNVMGAMASLEAAKDYLIAQKLTGHLVGISSVAAFKGLPASSAYCTSKAALMTYLESLRVDLKPHGISVSSIHPGYIKTPMTDKNVGPMPFILSAEEGARRITRAILKQKSRFVFPFPLRVGTFLLKLMPDFLYDWLIGFRYKEGVFR